MTALAATLAFLAAALFLWSYLLYPLRIARLAGVAAVPSDTASGSPLSTEVILSAADEEDVIAERVRNLLAQKTGTAPYRITIGCDGCRDKTAERAREAGDGRVNVIEFSARRGKAAVLNDLVAASRADVIVFTDANTRFESGAVRCLVERFGDRRVGSVCGRLLLEREAGARETPEALFWDRETKLKEAEGQLGVCLGANGAIYAARRGSIEPLPPDTSMDDFLIPARIARQGLLAVFAGDAVAREPAGSDVRAELSRRFRLGVGAGEVLRRERWLYDFRRHPRLTLAYLSRKVARWAAPVFLLLSLLAGLASPPLFPAAAIAFSLALIALATARARPRLTGPLGKLYYFGVMNLALAAGVAAGLAGYRRPVWVRTARA